MPDTLSVHVRALSGKHMHTFKVLAASSVNDFISEIQEFMLKRDTRKIVSALQLVLEGSRDCLNGDDVVGQVLTDGSEVHMVVGSKMQYMCGICGRADDADSNLQLQFDEMPRFLLTCCKKRLCETCFHELGGSECAACPMECGAKRPTYAWSVHTPSAPPRACSSHAQDAAPDDVDLDDAPDDVELDDDDDGWLLDEISQPLAQRTKSWLSFAAQEDSNTWALPKLDRAVNCMTVHCPCCKAFWCGVLATPIRASTSLQRGAEPQVVSRGQHRFLAEQPQGYTVPPTRCNSQLMPRYSRRRAGIQCSRILY